MTFEQPNNEIPSDKTDKEFQYWFKEYDDALREHNLYFLEKRFNEETKQYSIKFKRTNPAREFTQSGASWEDCFQAMIDETAGWDTDLPQGVHVNMNWGEEDIQRLRNEGTEKYPEINYARIVRLAKEAPTRLTEDEMNYFFEHIREDDYELAADIKKLWESSKK